MLLRDPLQIRRRTHQRSNACSGQLSDLRRGWHRREQCDHPAISERPAKGRQHWRWAAVVCRETQNPSPHPLAEGERIKPADVDGEEIQVFCDKELPELRDLASGKTTKAKYNKESSVE